MTWATFDVWGDDEANGPEQVHVIPTYEEHDVSVDCWCGPRGDEGVFVHRDKLDRDPPEGRRKPADTLLSEQLEEARRWHLTAVNEKLAAQADAERLFTALDGYIMARITGTDLRDYDDLAERAARAHRALATDVPGKLDRTVLDPPKETPMASRVVWKFTLSPWTAFVSMPVGAQIVHVGAQGADVCVWALCDPDAGKEPRYLAAVPTGAKVPGPADEFVGTVQMDDGLVFHIFGSSFAPVSGDGDA